jgi:hypothetical protein
MVDVGDDCAMFWPEPILAPLAVALEQPPFEALERVKQQRAREEVARDVLTH